MKICLIVSCEKQQELNDLELVIDEVRKEAKGVKVILINMTNFTGEEMVPSEKLFDEVITPYWFYNQGYYKLGRINKIITIIYATGMLMYLCKKYRATHFLYGVSIAFFRTLNSAPFQKYITFSYIRSTIVSGNINTKKNTKPYVADYFFCIDNPTKEYINNLHLNKEENRVLNIGSIYSYTLLKNYKNNNKNQSVTNICFLTSAFAWHKDLHASRQQVLLLEEIIKKLAAFNRKNSKNLKLFLKLHPRDNIELYHKIVKQEKALIMPEIDVGNLNGSYCFISILSTLSSELRMAGLKSLYLCNDFFEHKYAKWYEKNSIIPLKVLENGLIEKIVSTQEITSLPAIEKFSPQKILALYLLKKSIR